MVDGAIIVLFYGNEFENWSVFQTDWLFWSKTEEFLVVGFREVSWFYVNVLGQSVSLVSSRFVSWEKIGLQFGFFSLIKVLNFKENSILNTESSWCTSIKFCSSELFKKLNGSNILVSFSRNTNMLTEIIDHWWSITSASKTF